MHCYPNLFAEGKIGSLSLKNRFVMGPVETLYGSACGEVTPELISFYARRAQGGVGLIMIHSIQGNVAFDPVDPYAGSLRLDNNAYIPRMSDLTEAVHFAGAKVAALVSIGGGCMAAGDNYITASSQSPMRVAPNKIAGREDVRALRQEEIHSIVDNYGKCAGRAKTAGFDAIAIHAVGGYLLAEFLSPHYNKRNDRYGGSAENRWRLLFELIHSCRKYAGQDFPLILRIAVDEMSIDGRTLQETMDFLPKIESAGINALDITAGTFDCMGRTIPSIYVPRGINLEYAKRISGSVSIPVIFSGKLQDPEYSDHLVEQGVCDFISISRALLAEPNLPNYIRDNNQTEIRKCISCNYCIGHRIRKNLPIRCAVNPCAGREWNLPELLVSEASLETNRMKVTVIGGGPAGLEAAVTLASRGFQVDIFEREKALCGGQLYIASIPPYKQTLKDIQKYYINRVAKFKNINVYLNSEINADNIDRLDSDFYLVATGGTPIIPNIPGANEGFVYTAQDALLGRCEVGTRILIIGGGQIGAETALYFAQRKKSVSIVEMQNSIAKQEEPLTRNGLISLLENYKVSFMVNHRIISFNKGNACLQNVLDGTNTIIPYDTALLALGSKSNHAVYNALRDSGKTAFLIGDAAQVGNLAMAITSAHMLARALPKLKP